jgi:hypothetical protein
MEEPRHSAGGKGCRRCSSPGRPVTAADRLPDLPGLAAAERAVPLPGALVAVVAARKAGAPPPVPGAADIAEARCLDTRRSR